MRRTVSAMGMALVCVAGITAQAPPTGAAGTQPKAEQKIAEKARADVKDAAAMTLVGCVAQQGSDYVLANALPGSALTMRPPMPGDGTSTVGRTTTDPSGAPQSATGMPAETARDLDVPTGIASGRPSDSASQATGTSGATPATYHLMANSGITLKEHVGHRVLLTGSLTPASGASSMPSAAHQRFTIKSLEHLGACDSAKSPNTTTPKPMPPQG